MSKYNNNSPRRSKRNMGGRGTKCSHCDDDESCTQSNRSQSSGPSAKKTKTVKIIELHPDGELSFPAIDGPNGVISVKLRVNNIFSGKIRFNTKFNSDKAMHFAIQPNSGSLVRDASTELTVSLNVIDGKIPPFLEFMVVAETDGPRRTISETHKVRCVYTTEDSDSDVEDVFVDDAKAKQPNNDDPKPKNQNKEEAKGSAEKNSPKSANTSLHSSCNAEKLSKATYFYKTSQAKTGLSRVLKRSYLEKAIRIYNEEIKNTNVDDELGSMQRNIGMSNFRLAEVVDDIDPVSEVKLVCFYLKEAVSAFTKALLHKESEMDTEWGEGVEERILDCFDLGFRRAANRDVENERLRSFHLDKLIEAIPQVPVFDILRGKCYLAKAQYYHRRCIVAQEENDIVSAVRYLEYSNEEAQHALVFDPKCELLRIELRVLQSEIEASRSTCESLRARYQADKEFKDQTQNQEGISMLMMWNILDMYKQAVLYTREMDIENEAIALSRMGRMYEKIFKMKIKAHESYRRAFDLAVTLRPRDLSHFDWFKETKDALERYQRNVVLEEQKREDELKAPILKKLEAELKILEKKSNEKTISDFLVFVYAKYPPKLPHTFNPDDPLNNKGEKAALKDAITHYHPDRQAKFGLEWKVLCGEITKYLTYHYESRKC